MTEENTTDAPVTEAAPAQDSPELSINDLVQVRMIIDVASSRGAFKPEEMVVVGTTYTKLKKFIESVAKPAQEGTQE